MSKEYNIFDLGYDHTLDRSGAVGMDVPSLPQINNPVQLGTFQGGLGNTVEGNIAPQQISSGALASILFSGKETFLDTTAGYRMGKDETDNIYKWIIGDGTSSVDWAVTTAATLTVKGTLYSSVGVIGGWTINATTLTGGDATLDSAGDLTLGTTNNIIRLSATDATYRLWVGHATAALATFSVTKAGAIYATSGTIGGWTLSTTSITDTAGIVGISSTVTGGDDIRFWAGHATPASAPFRVTETGVLTSTSGYIGGWVIGATSLTDAAGVVGISSAVTGGDDIRFWAGNATPASAPFKVTEAGVLTSTSGAIGGWIIGTTSLTDTAGTVGISSAVTVGDDIRFWAGNVTPASAPFRVTEAGVLTSTSGIIGGWIIASTSITDTAGAVGMSSAVTGGDDIRFWAGHATPASAPFYVTEAGALVASSATITGSITATSGAIGGFEIGSDYIRDAANTFGFASTVTGGDDIRFWAGDTFVNRATAPARITEAGVAIFTSGTIGGWTLAATTLTATGIILDAGNQSIYLGSVAPRLVLDGANKYIRTSTYTAGLQGFSIESDGSAEFNNITARGEFHTQVLSYGELHGTAGSQVWVKSAGKLKSDVTTVTSPTTFNIDIEDPDTGHVQLFAVSDILRLKDGSGLDNWCTVSSVSDQTTFFRYVCTKNSGTNGTFRAGAGVFDYGQSGQGIVYVTVDQTNAPYFSTQTHAGSPWTTVTERVRLGNLTGITDTIFGALSGYGLWTDNIYLTGSIVASTGRIGGSTNYWSIGAGSLVATGAGTIEIRAGQTAYDTGTGFWLGLVSGTAKLSFGNSAGNKITWDGTTLSITGSITATSGSIGGFEIGTDYIRDVANSFGLASTVTVGDDVRFWAGDTFVNRATAPFRITESGVFVATSATITGSITATSGAIGGWVIGATSLIDAAGTVGMSSTVTGGDDIRFWAGNVTPASAPFKVTEAGALTASSATITGSITATTGAIAAFTIAASTISATNLVLTSGVANTANITVGTGATAGGLNSANAGGDVVFWAGSTFANRATAPFYVTAAGALVATSATVNGSALAGNDIFGSGVDGEVTISGDTSLSTDMYYNNLTVNNAITLTTNGYRIFIKGTLTNNGTISWNGSNGSNGTASPSPSGSAAGGAGGGGLTSGTLYGSETGATGGTGRPGGVGGGDPGDNGDAGSNGTAITKSYRASFTGNGGVGGNGGNGGGGVSGGTGGAAGTVGTTTAAGIRPYQAHFGIRMLEEVSGASPVYLKYNRNTGGSGGGAGGGEGCTGAQGGGGGGGGGAGSNGGTMVLCAKTIVNAGTISANGGTGGNGGAGSDGLSGAYCGGGGHGGGGGGGGAAGRGGAGGVIILVYSSLSGAGSITANGGSSGTGGAKGLGGAGTGGGNNGSDGLIGGSPTATEAGSVIQLQV